MALAGCQSEPEIRDADGEVVVAGEWSVFDLRDGDCLAPPEDESGEVPTVWVVPCADPHTQEVFARVEHPPGPYPGAAEVATWADGACLVELDRTRGLTLDDDGVFVSYLLPTFVGWNKETPDREVVCVLVTPGALDAAGEGAS